MLGVMVRRGACVLLAWSRSCASAKISSLTIGGTAIAIQSSRGRSWLALLRGAMPPRIRSGRVIRCRGAIAVLPKQACPLYAGLRSMPQTVERSQRPRRLAVGMSCSFKRRAMAPMLIPRPDRTESKLTGCEAKEIGYRMAANSCRTGNGMRRSVSRRTMYN